MNINEVYNLPQHTIHLNNLNDFCEIRRYGMQHQLKYYAYAFLYKNLTPMKYGMSADNEWKTKKFLDRAYRQAGYLPGWNQPYPKSDSGHRMKSICEEFFPTATKDDVTLIIYDMTHYPFINKDNPSNEVKGAEDALIRNHTAVYGRKPYGNHNNSIFEGPDNKAFNNNFVF